MDEIPTGAGYKDHEGSEEVSISPKTPWNQLAEVKDWKMMDPRNQVTDDAILNARELFVGVNLDNVLEQIHVINSGRKLTGREAVKSSIAANLGTVAASAHWDMSDPRVVYMSGFHFSWAIGRNLRETYKGLENAEAGKRTFETEALKKEKLGHELGYLKRYKAAQRQMQERLTAYAGQNGLDETYQAILNNLLYIGDTTSHSKTKMTPKTRQQILEALAENRVGDAYVLMRESIEAGRGRYEYPVTEYLKQFETDS